MFPAGASVITTGTFIVFDGIDGSGKSTQARIAGGILRERSIAFTATKEPGGTPEGAALRRMLISTDFQLSPESELMLYTADRHEHQRQVIEPVCASGGWVLCDRFLPSTYAYQVFGRGMPMEMLGTLTHYAVRRMPDLTLIFDLPPAAALERALGRLRRDGLLEAEGKFEKLGVPFFEKVREGFLWYAKEFENVAVIDASRPIDAVASDVRAHITRMIETHQH